MRARAPRRSRRRRRLGLGLIALAGLGALVGGGVWLWGTARELDRVLVEKLSGRPWQIPSEIYSDSFVVHPGRAVSIRWLLDRLSRLQYLRVHREIRYPGEYEWNAENGTLDVHLHDFQYPGRLARGFPARIRFEDDRVTVLVRKDTGEALDSLEIEPEAIGGIFDDTWEDRRLVRLDELPSVLVHAVLAAEDRRFFDHYGVDLKGIFRALVANVRSGRVVQGGSTLTQQLVKNFFLTEARTLRRKVTEAAMAVLLERRFSKLEILELYLNEIYLGQRGARGIYGVWEASRFYFGKEPRDLTTAEAALLAGLIKAPNRYSPTRNPRRAERRRGEVLTALLALGRISPGEYEEAMLAPLPIRVAPEDPADMPYFVDFVRAELEGRFAHDELTSQGFRIFTTIDVSLQRAAEEALVRGLERLEETWPRLRAEGPSQLQAALVALEPRSGEIKAMVGGRSYRESQFNRVAQARRQLGSVFKPFVYVTAFEIEEEEGGRRYLPSRQLEDQQFTWVYDGGRRTWSPTNYKDRYHGTVTMRQALERSLNCATARLARDIGVERIREMAVRLGLPESLPDVPSLILGAAEVTPLEIARAFAAIANLGFRTETVSIRTVLDEEGEALGREDDVMTAQVISPRAAYQTLHLMEGVIDRGTGRGARSRGFRAPAAGKTGTTNEGRDAWFVGFTPDLLTVVWVGRDQGDAMGLAGSQAALPIWTDFMLQATTDREPTPFLVPPGIERVEIDPRTGKLATPECPQRFAEAFLLGHAPAEPCPLHRSTGFWSSLPERPVLPPGELEAPPQPSVVPRPTQTPPSNRFLWW